MPLFPSQSPVFRRWVLVLSASERWWTRTRAKENHAKQRRGCLLRRSPRLPWRLPPPHHRSRGCCRCAQLLPRRRLAPQRWWRRRKPPPACSTTRTRRPLPPSQQRRAGVHGPPSQGAATPMPWKQGSQTATRPPPPPRMPHGKRHAGAPNPRGQPHPVRGWPNAPARPPVYTAYDGAGRPPHRPLSTAPSG